MSHDPSAQYEPAIAWEKVESILSRDPGGRGVAGAAYSGRFVAPGQLNRAAASLTLSGGTVGIVTGFAIPLDDGRFCAETDGPPGALFLARALLALGNDVVLIGDEVGVPALLAGCDLWDIPRSAVREIPFEPGGPESPERRRNAPAFDAATDAWCDWFFQSLAGRSLTHLVSIERVGPSHTPESVRAQKGFSPGDDARFDEIVPRAQRNVCQNMRGHNVNAWTAKTHRLFEIVRERSLSITTLGCGDGGNEIGMSCIPWAAFGELVKTGSGHQIACRIATDYLLTAGVSNWIGYALGLALCVLRRARRMAKGWDADDLKSLLTALVAQAGCVDGVTRRHEPTVDGLPPETYLQTFRDLRDVVLTS
ncbi:MAG: DUF4392 domain-containing protein [Planctomycetia bacterium]|nr:DUF4392 domain-containing protein [Planctomycetia bacterium]